MQVVFNFWNIFTQLLLIIKAKDEYKIQFTWSYFFEGNIPRAPIQMQL